MDVSIEDFISYYSRETKPFEIVDAEVSTLHINGYKVIITWYDEEGNINEEKSKLASKNYNYNIGELYDYFISSIDTLCFTSHKRICEYIKIKNLLINK